MQEDQPCRRSPSARSGAVSVHGLHGPRDRDRVRPPIDVEPGRMGYFASRSAAMGRVGAAVVTATFYSFSPDLIGEVIPRAWTLASPEAIVAARWRGADTALHRMLGDRGDSPEVAQAAELIRRATEGLDVSGRPLFAAHTELPRPVEPHLAPELGATPRAA